MTMAEEKKDPFGELHDWGLDDPLEDAGDAAPGPELADDGALRMGRGLRLDIHRTGLGYGVTRATQIGGRNRDEPPFEQRVTGLVIPQTGPIQKAMEMIVTPLARLPEPTRRIIKDMKDKLPPPKDVYKTDYDFVREARRYYLHNVRKIKKDEELRKKRGLTDVDVATFHNFRDFLFKRERAVPEGDPMAKEAETRRIVYRNDLIRYLVMRVRDQRRTNGENPLVQLMTSEERKRIVRRSQWKRRKAQYEAARGSAGWKKKDLYEHATFEEADRGSRARRQSVAVVRLAQELVDATPAPASALPKRKKRKQRKQPEMEEDIPLEEKAEEKSEENLEEKVTLSTPATTGIVSPLVEPLPQPTAHVPEIPTFIPPGADQPIHSDDEPVSDALDPAEATTEHKHDEEDTPVPDASFTFAPRAIVLDEKVRDAIQLKPPVQVTFSRATISIPSRCDAGGYDSVHGLDPFVQTLLEVLSRQKPRDDMGIRVWKIQGWDNDRTMHIGPDPDLVLFNVDFGKLAGEAYVYIAGRATAFMRKFENMTIDPVADQEECIRLSVQVIQRITAEMMRIKTAYSAKEYSTPDKITTDLSLPIEGHMERESLSEFMVDRQYLIRRIMRTCKACFNPTPTKDKFLVPSNARLTRIESQTKCIMSIIKQTIRMDMMRLSEKMNETEEVVCRLCEVATQLRGFFAFHPLVVAVAQLIEKITDQMAGVIAREPRACLVFVRSCILLLDFVIRLLFGGLDDPIIPFFEEFNPMFTTGHMAPPDPDADKMLPVRMDQFKERLKGAPFNRYTVK